MRNLDSRRVSILLLALLASACVNTDPNTGEAMPRGSQRYEFSEVKRNAEDLKVGMTKMQVLFLLGSPAEQSGKKDVWVYLPERYGILVPAQALRLKFRDQILEEFGFRPIILGERF